jgi:copper chaperone
MTCGHCASRVTQALKLTDPACQVSVDLKAQKVQVQSTDDRQNLADALTEAGYPPA